jgi:hypothetical protein
MVRPPKFNRYRPKPCGGRPRVIRAASGFLNAVLGSPLFLLKNFTNPNYKTIGLVCSGIQPLISRAHEG